MRRLKKKIMAPCIWNLKQMRQLNNQKKMRQKIMESVV